MILPIVRYGHPALRGRALPVEGLTPQVRQLASDLLDTMYAAHGIGLAAPQVSRLLRVVVLDVRGVQDRPSTVFLNDEPADLELFMPLVLINPEIRPTADPVTGPEGCLSFPELFGEISRPAEVEVTATGLEGRPLAFRCGGLLAKAIQHEVDHLNGILFIDRMTAAARSELKPELDLLMADTKAALAAETRKPELR
jgi:peptide deformylase